MRLKDKPWFAKLSKTVDVVSIWFERVGLVGMSAMALTTLIDVIGSKVFDLPLPGSTEIISVIQITAIAGGLAYSLIDGRQIRVDILIDWLPDRARAVLDVFGALVGLALFIIAFFMMYAHAADFSKSGTSTFLLHIPLAPFAFWITLCCIPMCGAIFIDLLRSIGRMFK